jgi:hypothetical protein
VIRENNLYYRLGSEDTDIRQEAQDSYREWLRSPVTQEIIECLTHMQNVIIDMPLPPDGMTGNGLSSAQRMWMVHGFRRALSRIQSMDKEAYENLKRREQVGSDTARPHDDFFTLPVAT